MIIEQIRRHQLVETVLAVREETLSRNGTPNSSKYLCYAWSNLFKEKHGGKFIGGEFHIILPSGDHLRFGHDWIILEDTWLLDGTADQFQSSIPESLGILLPKAVVLHLTQDRDSPMFNFWEEL